jgi:hypothetical protein
VHNHEKTETDIIPKNKHFYTNNLPQCDRTWRCFDSIENRKRLNDVFEMRLSNILSKLPEKNIVDKFITNHSIKD